MAHQTEQVKNCIAALRAAGFDRSEFKVNVQRLWRNVDGKRFYEYGDAEILLLARQDKAESLVPAMLAAGLNVTILKYGDGDGGTKTAYPILDNNCPHGQYKEVVVK